MGGTQPCSRRPIDVAHRHAPERLSPRRSFATRCPAMKTLRSFTGACLTALLVGCASSESASPAGEGDAALDSRVDSTTAGDSGARADSIVDASVAEDGGESSDSAGDSSALDTLVTPVDAGADTT